MFRRLNQFRGKPVWLIMKQAKYGITGIITALDQEYVQMRAFKNGGQPAGLVEVPLSNISHFYHDDPDLAVWSLNYLSNLEIIQEESEEGKPELNAHQDY